MRLIIYLAAFLMLFYTTCANAITTIEYVNALERTLFGTIYDKQNIQTRIDRIEKQIYDNNYTGSPEERLAKIDKIYPKTDFETQKIQNNEISSDEWYSQDYPEEPEKADYNNYPVVSEIEQTIYKKDFKGEDIYKRLARLEQDLYGNAKEDLNLQERVTNLKSVLPKKHYDRFSANNFGFKDFGLKQPKEYVSESPFSSEEIVKELELETFNKTYENDIVSHRIERLENYYFGGASFGQSEEERLSRIASITMNSRNMKDYFPSGKGAQWAGILMNLLMIGLGFLL